MRIVTVVVVSLFSIAAFVKAADAQCACQPSVSYYAPAATTAYYAPATTAYYAPTTAYYAPPVTAYYAPTTAYYAAPVTAYYAPTTAYYAAPVTSYYAPVYRPGLFGWRARRAYWSGVPVVTPY